MPVAYLFEARSIQNYLFAGGKLRDMMAASDMVDRLCDEVLDTTLEALGMCDDAADDQRPLRVRFPRRAGGAFYAVLDTEEQASRLRDLWSFTVARYLPGLETLHVLAAGVSDAKAVASGQAALLSARNSPAVSLPEAGPLVVRCQRTGLPAVALDKRGKEAIDASLLRRRDQEDTGPESRRQRLGSKFMPRETVSATPQNATWVFPCDFERGKRRGDDPYLFPFNGEERTIAIIHADGNGLGLILRQLSLAIREKPESYTKAFRGFSTALENATRTAAAEATAAVLMPMAANSAPGDTRRTLPARPLVLGGDDLTIIVRADLAIAFAQKFVESFEATSERELANWKGSLKSLGVTTKELPTYLTACAGIVFLNAGQPFAQAYELAESLCQRAKNASEKVRGDSAMKPSSLAFARITTSSFEDAEHLYHQKVEVAGKPARLTLGSYGIGRHASHLPTLSALESLLGSMRREDVSGGPARKFMTVLQQDVGEADRLWKRWLEILRERNSETTLLTALATLGVYDIGARHMPFVGTPAIGMASPFGDIHDLDAVGHITLADIAQGDRQ